MSSTRSPFNSPALVPSKNILSSIPPLSEVEKTAVAEPLCEENPNRHVIFPIEHADIWAKQKQHMSVFWIPEEVDLSKDLAHWNEKLNDNERHFIKQILGFFAGSDGIVMENLAMRFTREIGIPEAKFFQACQNMMESIHSETQSLMIDTQVQDKEEKLQILRAIQTIPCVQEKAKWALQWIDSNEASFACRLLAFAVIEGIFFSGAFCSIYWLKQRGLMPGLTLSNEFIARDEGLHTEFACLLQGKLQNKLTTQEAHTIISEAVEIEKNFITKALPCELIGMNARLMSQQIEFVADRLVVQLGQPKIQETANPFDFMDRISLEGKTNFFEQKNSNYSKANTQASAEKKRFATDEDF